VTSVGLAAPTGFSVTGPPVTTSGNLTLSFAAGYSLPLDSIQADWNTAFSERLRWDGSNTGLNATTARTSLELGSAATAASSDFATAAQGSLAATAVQPAALGSYQPLDSDLTSIAALTTMAFGRSLLTQADAVATRTTLGAGTVTGVTAAGPITSSGGSAPVISTSMATSRLLGRSSAGTGVAEEISLGANMTLSGGVLSASVTGGGGGTVTSVGFSLPGIFSVSGSPITTAGLISASLATQSANLVLAGPTTGVPAPPTFRTLVAGDIPTIASSQVSGLGSLATQSGTFSGTSSGTNTGDNAVNTLYSGLVSNANHTGDATGSTVLTLATVNENLGSFGSATAAPAFTVNAKGLITAASSTTITPAVGSITGLGTGVATALAANVGSTGAPVVLGGAGGTPSSITLTSGTDLPLSTGVTGVLPVANGGTGTTAPGLVQGANVTISGSWPNQTISASGVGGGGGSNNNYAIGRYFTPFDGRIISGSANTANTISLIPFTVKRGGTVTEIYARVQTAAAGSLFQLAVYAMGANGDPTGLPIGATASMSSAAGAGVADTLTTTFDLAANTPYYLAVNVNSGTTVAFAALAGEISYPWTVCGPSSLTGFNPGLGTACFNNTLSHTFGTWPNVTGATFGTVFGASRVPVALFKYGAFV
jgi:hypothetical protein